MKTLNFLPVRKESICLMRLVESSTSNSDNLYSKPECHVVSIYKNTRTAAVDLLLLKFRVTDPPASYIEVSYCDLLES
jgi:hypothetical protein